MDMTDVPLLAILKSRMGWLGKREGVLSENVANADTPAYTARDLKASDFEKVMKSAVAKKGTAGTLAVTDPRHMTGAKKAGAWRDYTVRDKEADPTGNSVSLEQEMIKVADTQAQFQTAVNLYAKALGMMKTALGKGGNS